MEEGENRTKEKNGPNKPFHNFFIGEIKGMQGLPPTEDTTCVYRFQKRSKGKARGDRCTKHGNKVHEGQRYCLNHYRLQLAMQPEARKQPTAEPTEARAAESMPPPQERVAGGKRKALAEAKMSDSDESSSTDDECEGEDD